DAALAQFAEHGFKGATIKGIAAAAGVSHGLLQHHFGSKDDLRGACDEYALQTFGTLDSFGVTSGEITNPDFLGELSGRSLLILRYIARAMVEGSPAASAFYENGASLTERFLSQNWPERFPEGSDRVRDAASVMAAMHLSTIVLHEHLSRRMGSDVLATEGASRLALGILDVYTSMGEFTASGMGQGIRDAVVKQQESHPTTNGGDDA
ncbi:TetR/AcrR family transcriptional regulator, partial [Actinomadura adrarensis]